MDRFLTQKGAIHDWTFPLGPNFVLGASTVLMADAWRTLVPTLDDPDGPLPPLLVVLTVVTGVIDAVSYLSLGHVFVANMTGNVVFVGFAFAGAAGFALAPSLIALGAFVTGSAVGGRIAVELPRHRGRLLTIAVTVELVLVAAATAGSAAGGSGDATQDGLIALLGVAMGVQNAVVRRLGVSDLTTTVLTLTTTAIVADAVWLGGPGGRNGRRVLSVTAMFSGALVGAVVLLHASRTASLAVSLALIAIVALRIATVSRGEPRWATGPRR